VGQRSAVAFDGCGAGTVVADDAAQVLHHGERKRRVMLGSRRVEEARASGSPRGWTAAMAQWNLGRGAAILASEAGGLSEGRTEEAAVCLSSSEKEQRGKGEQDGDGWLLNALGRATEGKRGRQGGGARTPCGAG
jgi:hypothetical protein